jgi:transposase
MPTIAQLGPRVRLLLDMLEQWHALDKRITALDDEFADMARNDPAAHRLATLNATALVAAIRDGRTFRRSRFPHKPLRLAKSGDRRQPVSSYAAASLPAANAVSLRNSAQRSGPTYLPTR